MLKNKGRILQIIYCLIGVFLFGLIIVAMITDMPADSPIYSNSDIVLEAGWKDSSDNEVDIYNLTTVENANTGEWVSIYKKLPDKVLPGSSFCMQTGYIYYKIYIDGKLIYEPDIPESILYNKSFGHAWCYVPISEADAGKQIEIKFVCSYPNDKAYIRNVKLSNSGDYIVHSIHLITPELITSCIMLFIGIILILISIPIMIQSKASIEMIYLGVVSVFVALWSMSETKLIQMIFDNSRTMNILSDISLFMIPIPAIFYADMAIRNKLTRASKSIATISCCQIILSIVLHFTGIAEFRSLLPTTHFVMIVGAVYILYRVIKAIIKREMESAVIYQIFRIVGLVSFVIGTIIDIIRYYNGCTEDRGWFVRFGLIIFVMCYGAATIEKIMNEIQRKAERELITKLAYEDGLTGVGNRTAYQEYKSDIKEKIRSGENISVGIVMFDINDLKVTNDKYGHILGDKLIKQSSEIMKQAFTGDEYKIYRIGGDEFVVLYVGKDARDRLTSCLEKLQSKMDEYNEKNSHDESIPYIISIAAGLSCYNADNDSDSFEKMVTRADSRMYKNKRNMKKHNIKQEDNVG